MYAQELTKSLKPTTAAAVGSVAALTWFFSAIQCNKQNCYTTDNPITQVALAGTLATVSVMAITSAPVVKTVTPYVAPITKKINQAKTYLESMFSSKKSTEAKTVDSKPAEATASTTETPITEQEAATNTVKTPIAEEETVLPRTGSGFFTPKSDSVQANASETAASPHRTPSPSPTHLQS